MKEVTYTTTEHISNAISLSRFGPITLCEVTYGDRRDPQRKLVSTAQLAHLRRSLHKWHLSDVIAQARHHVVLTEAGLAELSRQGASWFFAEGTRRSDQGGNEHVLWPNHADPSVLKGIFSAMGPAELRARVVEVAVASYNLWAVDSTNEDGPLRLPVAAALSDKHIYVHRAVAALENNPAVLSVHWNNRYDPDDVGLGVNILFLPDEASWAALCEETAKRYAQYVKPGERPAGPTSHDVETALTSSTSSAHRCLVELLGLEPHIRAQADNSL